MGPGALPSSAGRRASNAGDFLRLQRILLAQRPGWGSPERQGARAALRHGAPANGRVIVPFPLSAKAGGRGENERGCRGEPRLAAPSPTEFLFTPDAVACSPPWPASPEGRMFTFNPAFFPPRAPADVLTAAAGSDPRGPGTPSSARRFGAPRACPRDGSAIATCPGRFMPLRPPVLIWKGSGPRFRAIWCRWSRGSPRLWEGRLGTHAGAQTQITPRNGSVEGSF